MEIFGQIVNRSNGLLSSSCSSILNDSPSNLKGKLWVKFEDEEGVGAGPIREWLRVLCLELFDINNALFELSSDGVTFFPFQKIGYKP